MLQLIHLLSLTLFINVITRRFFSRITEPQPEPGIEWVQALGDTSGSALCYLSNETRAPIANPPNREQLEDTPYHSPKLHPGPSSSVGMGQGTDRHADKQTHRRPWPASLDSNINENLKAFTRGCTICVSNIFDRQRWIFSWLLFT